MIRSDREAFAAPLRAPASLLVLPLLSMIGSLFGSMLGSTTSFAAPPSIGLSDLFRATVDGSDDVRSSIAQKEQFEALKSQGYGALLPQITGTATYFRTDLPNAFGGANAGGSAAFFGNRNTQKTVRLTARQFIFRGGQEYAFLSKSSRLVEAREAGVSASRQKYYLDLATAYYDLLLKQAEVRHSTVEVKLFDEQIAELRSRVRIGRSRSSELLMAQASRATAEGTLRSSQSALIASRILLSNLSRLPEREIEVREEVPAPGTLAPLADYLRLSEQRPDLVAARKARDAAAEEVAFQRNAHFPTLDVSGNYYFLREGVAFAAKWDALVTLTLPIFSGGGIQAAVHQAASAMKTAEVETGRLERTAENDIRSLHQSLVASEEELKSFAAAVDLAQRSYDQTRKDYRFGLTTNLDLVNSLKILTEAKRNHDRAKYRRHLERVRIEISAGRLPALAPSKG